MSNKKKRKAGDRGRGSRSLPSMFAGAMADAFEKAGWKKGTEKEAQTRQPDKRSQEQAKASAGRGESVKESDVLAKAYKGVEPLKPAQVRVKNRRQNQNEKVSKQSRSSRPSHTVSRSGKAKTKPAKPVTISGPFLSQRKPQKGSGKAEKEVVSTRLLVNDETTINPAVLEDDRGNLYESAALSTEDIRFGDASDGEIELIVGVDFGTTYCKVVVQEPDSGRAWAIPFSDHRDKPFLLSTKIVHTEGQYGLDDDGDLIGNLKVPLLNREMSANHGIAVVAFLALVLRHVKAWVAENIVDDLGGASPFWSFHMGLPARNLEDNRLVSTFRKMLWASAILAEASGSSIQESDAKKAFASVQQAIGSTHGKAVLPGFGEVYASQVGVYPEIAAQIVGYLRSDMWDQSERLFMLVDVGGGTVDGAIFTVTDDEETGFRFSFLRSGVKPLGVYMLHRERVRWHVDELAKSGARADLADELSRVLDENLMPATVPALMEEYLRDAEYPERTSDSRFYSRFRDLLWEDLLQPVRSKMKPGADYWKKLPFLLCGGGRQMDLYCRFIKCLNSKGSSTFVGLRNIQMPKPENLEGPGIDANEYQRISVAYGLSFRELGEILTPDRLVPLKEDSMIQDMAERYVGKELT